MATGVLTRLDDRVSRHVSQVDRRVDGRDNSVGLVTAVACDVGAGVSNCCGNPDSTLASATPSGSSSEEYVYDTGGQRIVRRSASTTTLYLPGAEITKTNSTGVLKGSRFDYFHAGVTKTGYYDAANNLFVGTVDDVVTTVFHPSAGQGYIDNLLAAGP